MLAALFLSTPPAGTLPDEPPVAPSPTQQEPTVVTRREHIREHQDGRYLGQTRTETRVILRRHDAEHALHDGRAFEGVELRFADTIRERAPVGRPVEFSREFAFVLDSEDRRVSGGEYLTIPSIWGFPAAPAAIGARMFGMPDEASIEPGTRWSASGEYRVARSSPRSETATGRPDPPTEGVALPFVAEYRYEGTEHRDGKELHLVSAGFRLRYPLPPLPEFEDPSREAREREYRAALSRRAEQAGISEVEARHHATILFTIGSWRPVLVNESITQQIRTLDGTELRREGFQLHWYRHPQPLELPEILRRADRLDLPDTRIEQRPGGIVVALEAVGFEPDSAQLLPRERERIRELAELLQHYRGAPVLAIGHTAEAGTQEGRKALSERRAEVVTEELVAAGIAPERLFFEGRGASEPIADNADEEGRRRNRRVELFILDDQADPDSRD